MIAMIHYASFWDFAISPHGLMLWLLLGRTTGCVLSIYRSLRSERSWENFWSPLLFASLLPFACLAAAAFVDFYVRMYGEWNGNWTPESKNSDILATC
jgi:hypothetical protein